MVILLAPCFASDRPASARLRLRSVVLAIFFYVCPRATRHLVLPLMPSQSPQDILRAFARAARQKLAQGAAVRVPELGTFTVEHRRSRLTERDDGTVALAPPRDEVRFSPETDAA